MNSPTPPTQNSIPASPALRELMEEFVDKFLKEYPNDQSTRLVRGYWVSDYTDFLAKTYAAGVKAGLMEAREMMPEEDTPKGFCHLINLQNPCEGYNAYRKEALARLNDKINRLK